MRRFQRWGRVALGLDGQDARPRTNLITLQKMPNAYKNIRL